MEAPNELTHVDAAVEQRYLKVAEAVVGSDLAAECLPLIREAIEVQVVCDALLSLAGFSEETGRDRNALRDRRVLRLRHGLGDGMPMTFKKVGQTIGGLSDERTRQIGSKESARLRYAIGKRKQNQAELE